MAQRAEERVGERARVLVESLDAADVDGWEPADGDAVGGVGGVVAVGRGAHQAPETDGQILVTGTADVPAARAGELLDVEIVAARGVDLIAAARPADDGGRTGAGR
jgi:hypothetical protein